MKLRLTRAADNREGYLRTHRGKGVEMVSLHRRRIQWETDLAE